MSQRFYVAVGKRLFDVVAGSLLLAVASPLLAVIALVNRVQIGSPVLFRQMRPGLDGRPFKLMKFRTMKEVKDAAGNDLPDEQRLTSLGRVLRRYSLDELPELFNVVRGEMSLVGPRPLLMQYVDRYTPEQKRRQNVKPGLTGWCQVNGRNALTWDEKFKLDVWYVDHVSFGLDVRVVTKTIVQVLKPVGISHAGHSTMPEFLGSAVNPPGEQRKNG